MTAAPDLARGLVHATIRVAVKATLTLVVVGAALAWLVVLVPAAGIFGVYGFGAWLVPSLIFAALVRRELRIRREHGTAY